MISGMGFRLRLLTLCFCLVAILISTSSQAEDGLLNIRIERTVPKSEAQNLIRADEDVTENPNPGSGPGSTPTNSTTRAECLATANTGGSVCCMQYTWPGYAKDPQIVATRIPRNCSDVKEADREAVCFGPVVYSHSTTTRRPDPALVGEFCEANSHNCFCAGSSCLTYVIYENVDGQPRKNETHFCGTLRLTNDESAVTSGCYSETKGGFIHEVCACRNEALCNDSAVSLISRTALLVSVFVSTIGFLTT